MIFDFFVVLMTKNLLQQGNFYKDIIGLDIMYVKPDCIGLGKNNKVFILLKEDNNAHSHHLSENKGSQIVTLKCTGVVDHYTKKIKDAGFKVRDQLDLVQYNLSYIFLEDFDHNEICLEVSKRSNGCLAGK